MKMKPRVHTVSNIFFKTKLVFMFRKEIKTTTNDLTDTMKTDKKDIKDKMELEYAGTFIYIEIKIELEYAGTFNYIEMKWSWSMQVHLIILRQKWSWSI